jgi:protein-S-isoprenylcysteine O-methyltransferase Ste14
MKPYFLTHPVGVLYLLVLVGWYLMETGQFLRQRECRKNAARAGPRFLAVRVAYVAVVVATVIAVPYLAPGAAIGHGAALFAIGMVLLVAGVALRGWSVRALGQYSTFAVKVSPDQPVVANGPYRVLRHPSYAGGLLAITGIGLLYGNWVTLAALGLLSLALILWRIHVEENALLATLDGRYRAYAAQHKRLIPLVW